MKVSQGQFVESFNQVSRDINDWATRKGWNSDDPMLTNVVMEGPEATHYDIAKMGLMVTEIAEAIEGRRHETSIGPQMSDKIPEFSSVEEELADCIIRIMHHSAQRKLRVAEALVAKLNYNENRPYKHGKQA